MDMNKIVKNLIVTYHDNKKEFIETAKISSKGIITGFINQNNKFIETGFIPGDNIRSINTSDYIE